MFCIKIATTLRGLSHNSKWNETILFFNDDESRTSFKNSVFLRSENQVFHLLLVQLLFCNSSIILHFCMYKTLSDHPSRMSVGRVYCAQYSVVLTSQVQL